MKTIEEINITEEAIDPHISNIKSAKKIEKKNKEYIVLVLELIQKI